MCRLSSPAVPLIGDESCTPLNISLRKEINITIDPNTNDPIKLEGREKHFDTGTTGCGPIQYSLSKKILTCEDAGANEITMTVTSGQGETESATVIVNVEAQDRIDVTTWDITVQIIGAGVRVSPNMVSKVFELTI